MNVQPHSHAWHAVAPVLRVGRAATPPPAGRAIAGPVHVTLTLRTRADGTPAAVRAKSVGPGCRQPMAIVVAGGPITSTFLNLLVIPVLFGPVDDPIEWAGRRVPRRHAPLRQGGKARRGEALVPPPPGSPAQEARA